MDWGAFAGGLSGGLQKGLSQGSALKGMMAQAAPPQPDMPMQVETEIGDVPMGLQLGPPQQPSKFGGLRELMTRLLS
jgi:hypothetical protein